MFRNLISQVGIVCVYMCLCATIYWRMHRHIFKLRKFLDSLCFTQFLPNWSKGPQRTALLLRVNPVHRLLEDMDGSTITFISHADGLHISPSTHPFYCKTLSPSLCEEISTPLLYKTSPQLQYFKALSLLPLYSHHAHLWSNAHWWYYTALRAYTSKA